ncbi:type VI secretion system transmembrane protein TssO [Bacteroides faecium]|uniref:Type VI secretion system transmembrane protein TssO n=1 Tax=Bacteroides faecium TaxID=2715212 RepID=A0A6H0KN99_9BACE|nr:type VI secretion system transmembrane protein TssO [Bacteroides faecium]QIU94852.1 type VI secretion system transmembrane protein TssO [Bacteroides faecium]
MENSRKEKIAGFSYVSIIFLIFFFSCVIILFYRNTDVVASGQKEYDIAKIEQIGELRDVQGQAMIIIDSVYSRIRHFNPEIRANYEETEINFLLNDLKNLYESHTWDPRYKIFLQFADCCEMWLTDKKEIWSKKNNISGFTRNLEACEAGIAGQEKVVIENDK